MKKMYIGYMDFATRGPKSGSIETALLADFDFDKLSDEDKKAVNKYFENSENKEEFIDSMEPHRIYIGIDFINDPKGEFYVNEDLDENWTVCVENIYKTYEEAKKAFIKEAQSGTEDNPERAVIKIVLKK
jgi:hypothetical protein